MVTAMFRYLLKISIHAAQEGCDKYLVSISLTDTLFQSTQPKRAATSVRHKRPISFGNFNPRSPRGLRQNLYPEFANVPNISIHAAQEGCDNFLTATDAISRRISIHAAQEGCDNNHKDNSNRQYRISIHAAQEGCDIFVYQIASFLM